MTKPLCFLVLAFLVAGCANEVQGNTNLPLLEIGITSNNGGGDRALGNVPDETVTTQRGPPPRESMERRAMQLSSDANGRVG